MTECIDNCRREIMEVCMSALEENERQTNAVSDSNLRDPIMGIVQQLGCYVVSASTAVQDIRCKRCIHWNIEQQLKSALTDIFFFFLRVWKDMLQKMLQCTHDGDESKACTQYIATDGFRCFPVPGTVATVSALKLA